jgi:hypothetical protein
MCERRPGRKRDGPRDLKQPFPLQPREQPAQWDPPPWRCRQRHPRNRTALPLLRQARRRTSSNCGQPLLVALVSSSNFSSSVTINAHSPKDAGRETNLMIANRRPITVFDAIKPPNQASGKTGELPCAAHPDSLKEAGNDGDCGARKATPVKRRPYALGSRRHSGGLEAIAINCRKLFRPFHLMLLCHVGCIITWPADRSSNARLRQPGMP